MSLSLPRPRPGPAVLGAAWWFLMENALEAGVWVAELLGFSGDRAGAVHQKRVKQRLVRQIWDNVCLKIMTVMYQNLLSK